MIQKNLLALIFIIKCLLKRFKTEGNTYSLKRFVFVFEEFFEKVFLFVFVFAYRKDSDFKYKYILFQKIKFI
jgi:hypothetical protein